MKKFSFLSFFLHVFLFSAMTFASNWHPPVPIRSMQLFRLMGGTGLETSFTQLKRWNAGFSFAQRLGEGFEWGLAIKAGASSQALFTQAPFAAEEGGDVMFRFLDNLSPRMATGLQIDINYSHYGEKIMRGHSVNLSFGIPCAYLLNERVGIFAMPAVLLGGKRHDGSDKSRIFGRAFGSFMQLGLWIDFKGPRVWIQARPCFEDLLEIKNLDTEFLIGAGYEL